MAVYPAHGVGVIKSIETQTVAGINDQKFYVMEILGNSMTIMIPTTSSESVGLRSIVNKKKRWKFLISSRIGRLNRLPDVEQALP